MLMITRLLLSLSVALGGYYWIYDPVLAQGVPAARDIAVDSNSKNGSAVGLPATSKTVQKAATRDAVEDAVAKIDGVAVHKTEKPGFSIGALNPFRYIFKPITDVRKEVKNLSHQVNDFNTPLTTMQKPMVGLRQDLVKVQGRMQTLHGDIDGIHHDMRNVEGHIERIDKSLERIAIPVGQLARPVVALQKPVKAVDGQLKALNGDLHEMKDTVGYTTSAIFVAILVLGALVVFGTPVAGLFVYKHRTVIMQKLGQKGTASKTKQPEEAKIS